MPRKCQRVTDLHVCTSKAEVEQSLSVDDLTKTTLRYHSFE